MSWPVVKRPPFPVCGVYLVLIIGCGRWGIQGTVILIFALESISKGYRMAFFHRAVRILQGTDKNLELSKAFDTKFIFWQSLECFGIRRAFIKKICEGKFSVGSEPMHSNRLVRHGLFWLGEQRSGDVFPFWQLERLLLCQAALTKDTCLIISQYTWIFFLPVYMSLPDGFSDLQDRLELNAQTNAFP